jgi:predicted small lipoprotein YifL
MTALRMTAAMLALALLAACGADGVPERPEPRPAATPTTQAGPPGG